jgi:hypothetical protein
MSGDGDLLQEETTITEITIQPDGRVYVFGTSRQALEVLDGLRPRDARLGRLLGHVRAIERSATAVPTGAMTRAT